MKTIFALALVAALGGCNTIAGFGQDLSGGARAVQNIVN